MNLTDADKACFQIREKIIKVEMPPGSIIYETRLMEELGLGRTPIREALKQLKLEHLVVVVPRRGMFVADVAITDLQQIYEVRVELEAVCAWLAAQRITAKQLGELKRLVAGYRPVDKRDIGQILSIDRRFHLLLAEATGNKFLRREFEMYYNLYLRIWYLALDRIHPGDIDTGAYAGLITAIEARDARQIRDVTGNYVRHLHDVISRRLFGYISGTPSSLLRPVQELHHQLGITTQSSEGF